MEKLFAKIKKEKLDADEKAKIFSNLENFVDQNPAQEIESPYYNPWLTFFGRKAFLIPVVAFLLVISLTGSTVLAAKSSLPGNILYPVKILNEKVQSFTAIGPKAQAEVHAEQAISRLQEVEQIVTSKKSLNQGDGKTISDNFETQAQNVTNSINELNNSGQTEAASKIRSDFKSSLTEHEQNITNLLTDTKIQTQNKEELAHVYSDVHTQLEKTNSESDNNSNQTGQNKGEVKGEQTHTNTEKTGGGKTENGNQQKGD